MIRSRFAALLIGAASALALVACGAPAGVDSGPVKLMEAPGGQLPDGVRPTVYRLALKTDPSAPGFTGEVEIDVALDKPHARIWLHALGPQIDTAFARLPDGRDVPATFTGNQAEGGVGYLDFAEPLPAGSATLVMSYEAPYNFGLAGLYKVTQAGQDYLATQMQAIDARRMVPSFDEPRFKTPWALTVTAPEGLKVVGNTDIRESRDLGDGWTEHKFLPTRPLQSYLIALAVGPYDEVDGGWIKAAPRRAAPVKLRAFAAAGKGEKLAEAIAITEEMLLWQEDYFGEPYPYGKLDLIAAPDFAYGAMENAGAIIYREGALLIDERTSLAQRRSIFSTHAHELAHQWFGNLVTPAWWDDIWLNEAFATWMANKTMTAIDPGGEWPLARIAGGLGAMSNDSLNSARQVRNPVLTNGDINDAFDGITYQKGGSVLSMFETYLGEERFREGIRVHMRRFIDGVANVDDFMTSLEQGSGDTGITASFRTFILQPGIPMLDITVSCADGKGEMRVSQSRYAPLGSAIDRTGTLWQVPFAARVVTGNDSTLITKMLTTREETLPVGACPDYVMPNAGGTGYWRFALDEASAAKLAANYSALSAGEQMVFIDALTSGYSAGSVSPEAVLKGLEASVDGSPAAISLGFGFLRGAHARLDADSQKRLSAWTERTYGPLARRLQSANPARLTAQETLLRESLPALLLDIGNQPAAREALARRAEAYIGYRQNANPNALQAHEISNAFGIAAEERGWTFIEPALAYALASQNQTERGAILRALAARAEPRIAAELVSGAATTLPVSPSELYTMLGGGFDNTRGVIEVWAAFRQNFDAIIEKLPEVRKQQVAAFAGSLCSASGAAEAKAFFESKAGMIPGYERRLAQGLERAELCAAQLEKRIPDLAAALAVR